jgi:hypothetical protein
VFREHAQAEREILASQLNEHQASTFTRIKGEGVLESSPGEGTLIGMSVARADLPISGRRGRGCAERKVGRR